MAVLVVSCQAERIMGRGDHNDRKRPSQEASTGRSSYPTTSSSESINTPVHQPSGLSSPPGPTVPEQSLNNRSLGGPNYSPVSPPNSLSTTQPGDGSKKPRHNPREGSDSVSTEGAELQSVPVPSPEGEGQSTLPPPSPAPYPYPLSIEVPIPCPENKGRPAFPPLPYTPHPYSLCTGLSEEEFNKTVTQLFMDTEAGKANRKELFLPPALPTLSVVKTGLSEVSEWCFRLGVVNGVYCNCSASGGDWQAGWSTATRCSPYRTAPRPYVPPSWRTCSTIYPSPWLIGTMSRTWSQSRRPLVPGTP